MKSLTGALLAGLATFGTVSACAAEPLDLATRYGHYRASVSLKDDGSATESVDWSMTILKDTALEAAKRASVSYSTSAQTAEVVAAYTLKADGTRVDVPKDNYQVEVNRGRGAGSPVYSDRSTLSVVFPDVAVGDSVVFSFRLTETEPLFPGHYSISQVFYRQVAYDDVDVRFEYPASLWVQYDARGMSQAEESMTGDRKVIEWRYANPKPLKSQRRDFSVFDPDGEAGVAFSTFKTYAEIATAYGSRAAPKAAVTPRISELAALIVKDKAAPKDQAKALYEWVATNITYAGNCIGIGAVVPRDVSFVLDNKMGDCKDHATLLEALLAARGIRSTQALVNAGSVYRLPKVPVVSTVNHVINYLPDFDLYLDSTSDATPFGLLPLGDQDKPVLLVDGFKEGARTPATLPGQDWQRVDTAIKIAADGAVTGSVGVSLKGIAAANSRNWAKNMSKDSEADLVKNMLRAQGIIGSGKFEHDDAAALSDSFHYKIELNSEKYLRLPGAGAFYIYPPMGIGGSIGTFLQSSVDPETEADTVCLPMSAAESYVIELPKTMKVLSIPSDLKVTDAPFSYDATYRLKGNVLTVRRTIEDRTKGNTCSPQVLAKYKKGAEKVLDNLKEQVLYK